MEKQKQVETLQSIRSDLRCAAQLIKILSTVMISWVFVFITSLSKQRSLPGVCWNNKSLCAALPVELEINGWRYEVYPN